MNWKNAKISEVAKEQIWKEHVRNESQYMNWKDSFSINPYRLGKTRPVCDNVTKRPRRFLCRERALLESIHSQLASNSAIKADLPADVAKPAAPVTTEVEEARLKQADKIKETLIAVHKTPVQKYPCPQTESQEIGWMARPLLPPPRDFMHSLKSSDVTRHAAMQLPKTG